jgi:aminoglycoside phosphotransferase family enzyme
MKMIHVENKKTYQGEGVYIGRPSLIGNPYRIGAHGTREHVIARYRKWLWQQIKQQGEVYRELCRLADEARKGDLTLICWCKEQGRDVACHGDIVSAAILWLNSQR